MQMRTPALEITVIFRSLTRHAMAKLATLTHGQLGRRWRRHVDDDDGNLVTLMRWPSPGMVHAGYWTHESKGVTGWQSVSYRRLLGQLTVVKFSSAEKAKGTAGMLVSAITNFAVSLSLDGTPPRFPSGCANRHGLLDCPWRNEPHWQWQCCQRFAIASLSQPCPEQMGSAVL